MKKYGIYITIAACLIYIAIFLVPSSQEKFSLKNPESEEFYRLGTYQFAHADLKHLFENIAGFVLLAAIVKTLKVKVSTTAFMYLLAGLVAALPVWVLIGGKILGASVAIYFGFTWASLHSERYLLKPSVPVAILILSLLIAPVWYLLITKTAPGVNIISSSIYHLSGIVFGIAGYYVINGGSYLLNKAKIHCLRNINE